MKYSLFTFSIGLIISAAAFAELPLLAKQSHIRRNRRIEELKETIASKLPENRTDAAINTGLGGLCGATLAKVTFDHISQGQTFGALLSILIAIPFWYHTYLSATGKTSVFKTDNETQQATK